MWDFFPPNSVCVYPYMECNFESDLDYSMSAYLKALPAVSTVNAREIHAATPLINHMICEFNQIDIFDLLNKQCSHDYHCTCMIIQIIMMCIKIPRGTTNYYHGRIMTMILH
jgi:hypothetical protein